jgi:hypothetical protein
MPVTRSLKPYRVDEVRTEFARADVMFDRNRKKFFMLVGVERVEHDLLEECKKLGRAVLLRAIRYEWRPVIYVQVIERDEETIHISNRHGEAHVIELRLHFWRCEVTEHPSEDGRLLSREYADDFEERMLRYRKSDQVFAREKRTMNDATVISEIWCDDEQALPYTEETWAALNHINGMIRDLSKRLDALVKTPNFARRVLAVKDALALPAPRGRIPRPRRGT